MPSKVIIIDYGSQVTQLIARRVREAGVYSEIHPCVVTAAQVKAMQPSAIILSGGPASVGEKDAPALDKGFLDLGVPVLGICYGMQLLAFNLGGGLEQSETREYGPADLRFVRSCALWDGIDLTKLSRVWMSHGDTVKTPPAGFLVTGSTDTLEVAAMAAEAPAPSAGPAALYPVEVLEYTEGDRAEPRISKTYELSPMDDPALIPTGDFERPGCLYTLLDIVKEDQTETDSKYYTETVTLDSKSKDMEEIMPLLAATCETVTEDGYTGLLTLDTASIQVEASGYATSTRNVSATRSYPNLSEADVSLVPKSIEDSGRTLTLADVQWQEAGGFYNAAATYTGTASSKYATGYTVTADYAGEVAKTTSGTVLYTAVFGLAEEQEAVTAIPQPAAEGGGFDWRWLLVLPAGAGAVGLVFLGRFLLQKYKIKKEWKEYNK